MNKANSSCSFLQSFYFRKREKHKITNINSLVVIMIHATKAKEGGKEMAELGTRPRSENKRKLLQGVGVWTKS